MNKLILATTIFVGFLTVAVAEGPWVTKAVGAEWTWCEDYVYAYATYVVACEPNRECQVGMGVFALGRPLGEKIRFTGQREITVVGFGALHMRTADGGGPAKIAFAQKNAELIKTTPIPW